MGAISPFLTALSASSAVIDSALIDWDVRLRIIEQATDTRSKREYKGLPKGKYSPMQFYISNEKVSGIYNDQKYTINKTFRKNLCSMLVQNGLEHLAKDSALINHFAYQYVFENPVVFEKNIIEFSKNQDDPNPNTWMPSLKLEQNKKYLKNSNIFEAVQSTNWNNMRFKPAKNFDGSNSWLVEFRPMDLPITSQEKYYLMFFTTLLHRIITDKKIFTNFYIPISSADTNMLRCVKRNAVVKEKFLFRKNFYGDKAKDIDYQPKSRNKKDKDAKRKLFFKNEMIEISLKDLLLGGKDHQGFKGLIETFISVNKEFLKSESNNINEDIVGDIWKCFDFMVKRSEGKLLTSSALIRKFVRGHKDYAFNSVVEGKVADDLIEFVLKVQTENYHQDLFD